MKYILCGALALMASTSLLAQAKVHPTDPQPSWYMCPGTFIPVAELNA